MSVEPLAALSAEVAAALASGEWVAKLDPVRQRTYYVNPHTRQSTWNLAKMLAARGGETHGSAQPRKADRTEGVVRPDAAEQESEGRAKKSTTSSLALPPPPPLPTTSTATPNEMYDADGNGCSAGKTTEDTGDKPSTLSSSSPGGSLLPSGPNGRGPGAAGTSHSGSFRSSQDGSVAGATRPPRVANGGQPRQPLTPFRRTSSGGVAFNLPQGSGGGGRPAVVEVPFGLDSSMSVRPDTSTGAGSLTTGNISVSTLSDVATTQVPLGERSSSPSFLPSSSSGEANDTVPRGQRHTSSSEPPRGGDGGGGAKVNELPHDVDNGSDDGEEEEGGTGPGSEEEEERAFAEQLQQLEAARTALTNEIMVMQAPVEAEEAMLQANEAEVAAAQQALADAVALAVKRQTEKQAQLSALRERNKAALQEVERNRALFSRFEQRRRTVESKRAAVVKELTSLEQQLAQLREVAAAQAALASREGNLPQHRSSPFPPAASAASGHGAGNVASATAQLAARRETHAQLRAALLEKKATLAQWEGLLAERERSEQTKRESIPPTTSLVPTAAAAAGRDKAPEEREDALSAIAKVRQEYATQQRRLQKLQAARDDVRDLLRSRAILAALVEAEEDASYTAKSAEVMSRQVRAALKELLGVVRNEEAALRLAEAHYAASMQSLLSQRRRRQLHDNGGLWKDGYS